MQNELIEMKTTKCEMKNILEEINNRLDTGGKRSNELKDIETLNLKNRNYPRWNTEETESIREVYASLKQSNIYVTEEPEKENRGRRKKNTWGDNSTQFSKLDKTYKPTELRNSTKSPAHQKFEENYMKVHLD